MAHQYRREGEAAQKGADQALDLSQQQGFPHRLATAYDVRGWARASLGHQEGIEEIEQGIGTWVATGPRQTEPYFLGMLAESCRKVRRPEDGLRKVNSAIQKVEALQEHFQEAELHRIEGDLLLSLNGTSTGKNKSKRTTEAEECFHKALEIARRQKAKS